MIKKIAIIGAGPAGLTAAYLLGKANQEVTIFEKSSQYVGGISRTETYKGYAFDIGGHRFFSKSKEVEDFWTEILGDELMERPRSSRIYYNNNFFSYPLIAKEALMKLGLLESIWCVLSYLKFKLFPIKHPANFEEWVTNQFGSRLFQIFFRTYTEKVWGISCKEISADWAAQRIKGLSLSSAIWNAIFQSKKTNDNTKVIKTLIDSFRYPKLGPGQLWETCRDKCLGMGVQLEMNTEITGLEYTEEKWNIKTANGKSFEGFDYVLSSAPIREIIPNITPSLNTEVIEAARNLNYRDFLVVILICQDDDAFNDNWIYIHEPNVKVGRIQNFKSWSPFMVPNSTTACYGLEYFCFEGDGLWNSKDEELIDLASKEMIQIGLASKSAIIDGYVVRQQKAYPVYDHDYRNHINVIRAALNQFSGIYLIGRNGMHKYNNQDHSMMTAMLAVKNILAGEDIYDLWNVNEDAEYHESETIGKSKDGNIVGRSVPEKLYQ